MIPLSIGFDWDDVVMPWYDPAWKICTDAGLNRLGAASGKTWHQHEDLGCTHEEWVAALDVATESGLLYDTVPFPGAVEVMRKLYWAGHFIHIVTARGTFHGNRHNERIHEITRAQVEEFAVPHHSLTFTRDKTAVPTDLFIDDNVRNFTALREAGVAAYLLTRPWNVDLETPYRVGSVEEFGDLVLQEAAA